MKSKKILKPTNKDKVWQQKIAKKVIDEKVTLDHPRGKELFELSLRRVMKRTKT
jgi:hypothetical protein